MKMTPYLGFDGDCREAFEFYAGLLGGTVEAMMSYGDAPEADEMCAGMPEGARERIMHACLVAEGAMLMGGDSPPGHHTSPAGIMVALEIEDIDRAERIFEGLADGGTVNMPFEETFWVEGFGMVNDRFGIPWAINGGKSKVG